MLVGKAAVLPFMVPQAARTGIPVHSKHSLTTAVAAESPCNISMQEIVDLQWAAPSQALLKALHAPASLLVWNTKPQSSSPCTHISESSYQRAGITPPSTGLCNARHDGALADNPRLHSVGTGHRNEALYTPGEMRCNGTDSRSSILLQTTALRTATQTVSASTSGCV